MLIIPAQVCQTLLKGIVQKMKMKKGNYDMASNPWNIMHGSYGFMLLFCSSKPLVPIHFHCMEKRNS